MWLLISSSSPLTSSSLPLLSLTQLKHGSHTCPVHTRLSALHHFYSCFFLSPSASLTKNSLSNKPTRSTTSPKLFFFLGSLSVFYPQQVVTSSSDSFVARTRDGTDHLVQTTSKQKELFLAMISGGSRHVQPSDITAWRCHLQCPCFRIMPLRSEQKRASQFS